MKSHSFFFTQINAKYFMLTLVILAFTLVTGLITREQFFTDLVLYGAIVWLLWSLSTIGIITASTTGEGAEVKVQILRGTWIMKGPFDMRYWWNYGGELGKRGRSNDLYVYLSMTDSAEHNLTFIEYIAFETRFPNEAPYEQQLPGDHKVFVHRADKLKAFFEKHLNEELS